MMKSVLLILASALVHASSTALRNEQDHLRIRPLMAYATWTDIPCGNLTESIVIARARKLIANNYYANGYQTILIDSCWMSESVGKRGVSEPLVEDLARFPEGVGNTARALHSLGFEFGVTLGGGAFTCDGNWGSAGHEAEDAKFVTDLGVDHVIMDSCRGEDRVVFHTNEVFSAELFSQNSDIQFISTFPSQALKKQQPNEFDWKATAEICDTYTVIAKEKTRPTWQSIIEVQTYYIEWAEAFQAAQRKGGYIHWGPIFPSGTEIDTLQSISQMTLWALLGAPLVLAGPIEDDWTRQVGAVLAIAQDTNPMPATFMRMYKDATVWGRMLQDGSGVIGVINNSSNTISDFTIDWGSKSSCWTISEAWSNSNLGTHAEFFTWAHELVPEDAVLFHFTVENEQPVLKQVFSVSDFELGNASDFAHRGLKAGGDDPACVSSERFVKNLRSAETKSTQ